jgi:hypothetical protein
MEQAPRSAGGRGGDPEIFGFAHFGDISAFRLERYVHHVCPTQLIENCLRHLGYLTISVAD